MSRRSAILQDYGGTFQPMPLDSQLQASQLEQRNNEFNAQMKQREKEVKQKEQGDATDFIGGLKVDHVGDNTIDLYNDAQIGKLQGELNGMQARGASVQDIKIKAMQELPKIAQGYTIAKNGYSQITNGLKDLNKDYPSGNMEAARNVAGKEFVNDIFNFDDKGNVTGYKDPSIIPQGKNYLANLETPDNLPKWYNPSGALVKHVSTLPHTTIGESTKIRDKKGRELDNAWTGTGTVFSTIKRDENGKAIGQDIKSETVPLGKNADGTTQNIEVLPKEEFNAMLGNKQAAADFSLQFNDHLKSLKIDPKTLDPRASDYLQRQYARDWLKETGVEGSSFIPKTVEKQPLPARTTINNNMGGTGANINDLFGRINTIATEKKDNGISYTAMNNVPLDAQNVIIDIANKGRKQEEYLKPADLFIKKEDDGKINIYKVAGIDEKTGEQIIKFNDAYRVGEIPRVGTNLKVQPNTKAKSAVVAQGNTNTQPSGYTNITETNKGKIGVKNGKWYDIKTGKPIQ